MFDDPHLPRFGAAGSAGPGGVTPPKGDSVAFCNTEGVTPSKRGHPDFCITEEGPPLYDRKNASQGRNITLGSSRSPNVTPYI